MKQRVIALFITFSMLISFIPRSAIMSNAMSIQTGESTRRLTDVKVYDESNTLTGTYTFHYDGDFLTGVTSQTYGEYAYESNVALTYDAAGSLVSRISGDPDTPGQNSGSKYTYDNAGQLISSLHWEGGGFEITYEYDTDGKLIREVENSDTYTKVTDYQSDENGVVICANETFTEEWSGNVWNSTVTYSYDSHGRTTKVSSIGGQTEATVSYSYQYQPFVLSEYSDNNGLAYSYLLLLDNEDETLHSFYLINPELYVDDNGYLEKVVDIDNFSNEIKTYIFTYDVVTEEVESNADSNKNKTWNQAYYDYIIEDREIGGNISETYELIYLDNDEIPEIWIYYEPTGQSGYLISYQNGSIVKVFTGRWGFEYAQSNKYFHCAGGTFGTGGCWNNIYALEDGEFKEVVSGSHVSGTGDYDGTVVYTWDGQTVSEEIYYNSIDQYLDPEITKRTYSDDSETYDYEGILEYLSSVKIEDTAELRVYTSFPYSTLGIDQTAKLLITLLVNGEPAPIQNCSLGNSNHEVIDLVDTKDADGVQVLTFKTLSPGIADLTFTEGSTGATFSITIEVEETCKYYRCSNFPKPAASSFPIYIADFQCTENSNGTHDVQFNAYNTSYSYGAAVVYDETGAFWGCVPLNPKYDGTGMEYIANGFWQSWEQTKYLFDRDKNFYEVAGNAILTEVAFKNIPQNAKIIITADGRESAYSILYTGIDIFLKSAFYFSNIDLKINVYQKSVKEFVSKMLQALPDDAAQNTIQTLTNDISKALIDGVNSESVEKIYQAVWNMLKNVGLNADEMLKDILSGLGYSVADTIIIAAIPAYSFVDIVNKIVAVSWLYVDYVSNLDRGKLEIHCVNHKSDNQLINSSVVVLQNSDFSQDTILDAYVVTESEELENLQASISSDLENFSVYNITLRESGVEVQPGEEIEIRIPIPHNVDPDKCVIYRIEEDDTLTYLPSEIEDGCVVFTTTHLSYYVIGEVSDAKNIQESDSISPVIYIAGAFGFVAFIGIIFTITVRFKRTKKRKVGKYER